MMVLPLAASAPSRNGLAEKNKIISARNYIHLMVSLIPRLEVNTDKFLFQ
jgi:hypothetical protein